MNNEKAQHRRPADTYLDVATKLVQETYHLQIFSFLKETKLLSLYTILGWTVS